MNLYVDEAGSITKKHKSMGNRYFVISLIKTDDPYNVIRQYRRAKKGYITENPNCGFDIKNEIKGSEMPYGMKKRIFENLSEKTDLTFHFVVIDNSKIMENLLEQSSLAFNYFLGIMIQKIHKYRNSDEELFMLIDERNQAVESLNSLQEYLTIELTLRKNYFSKVKTKYKSSDVKDLIQISDLFANTVFRVAKTHCNGGYDKKNRKLIECCNVGVADFFPFRHNDLDICK